MNPYAPPRSLEPPPEGAALRTHAPLASLGRRFGGAMIDGMAGAFVALPLARLLRELTGETETARLVFFSGFVVHFVQWFLLATRGQTIGKMLLRTKIVRRDGGPAGFAQTVALRSWPVIAVSGLQLITKSLQPLSSLVALADALTIFAGDERRTIHDRLAGTIVIQLEAQNARILRPDGGTR